MKKKVLAAFVLICGISAQASDPSEKDIPTSPLKIYSGGFGIGAVKPFNEDLKDVSMQFLKLSIVNMFAVSDNIELFLDAEWLLPGVNPGAALGIDYIFVHGRIRPFAGFGTGAHYFDHDTDFGEDFGISLTTHAGVVFDVTDNVALRARVPYQMVLNSSRDHSIGFECGFLFSSRFKHVRKLNYN